MRHCDLRQHIDLDRARCLISPRCGASASQSAPDASLRASLGFWLSRHYGGEQPRCTAAPTVRTLKVMRSEPWMSVTTNTLKDVASGSKALRFGGSAIVSTHADGGESNSPRK